MTSTPTRLIDAIQDGSLVIFVGEDLPGLGEAPAALHQALLADGAVPEGSTLAAALLWYQDRYGRNELVRRVREIYSTREREGHLKRLFSLIPRPRAVISLSVGDWAGRSLELLGQRPQRIFSGLDTSFLPASPEQPALYHLYGGLQQLDTLRLTTQERQKLPGTPLFDAVKKIMAPAPRLLIGRGRDDAVLPFLYEALIDDLEHTPPSFAIGPAPAGEAALLWKRLRVTHLGDDLDAVLDQISRDLRAVRRPQTRPAAAGAMRHPADRPPQIYKELNHYETADAGSFFGRAADLALVVAHIRTNHLTVLAGRSGAGKTSLLRAGVEPQLAAAEPPYAPIYLRPVARPVMALRSELRHLLGGASTPDLSIVELLDALQRAGRQAVLLLDQFEELFATIGEQERAELIQLLRELMPQSVRVKLVFVVRADKLADVMLLIYDLRGQWGLPPALRPFTVEQAREVIVEPAAAVGVSYEEPLVERIVADLSQEHAASGEDGLLDDGPRMEPPQIQLVCGELYKNLGADESVITMALYERLGGAAGILRRYLAISLARLKEHRELAEQILLELVGVGQSRLPRRADQIAAALRVPEPRVGATLELLKSARLVRELNVEGGAGYELAHEYLIGELKLSEADQDRKFHEKVIRDRYDLYARTGELMDERGLRLVSRSVEKVRVVPEHAAFMLRSAIEAQRHEVAWARHLADRPAELQAIVSSYLSPQPATSPAISRQPQREPDEQDDDPFAELDFLADTLLSPHERGRQQAAALNALEIAPPPDTEYEALLIATLVPADDDELRDAVIARLVGLPSERAVAALIEALQDGSHSNPRVFYRRGRRSLVPERRLANPVVALAKLGRPEADAALSRYYEGLLGGENALLRQSIIAALVDAFSRSSYPPVVERLLILAAVADQNAGVRAEADAGIATILYPENVRLLFQLAVPSAASYMQAWRELVEDQARRELDSGSSLRNSLAWLNARWDTGMMIHQKIASTSHNRAFDLLFHNCPTTLGSPEEAPNSLLPLIECELDAEPSMVERILGTLALLPILFFSGVVLEALVVGLFRTSPVIAPSLSLPLFVALPSVLICVYLLMLWLLANGEARPALRPLRAKLLTYERVRDYLWAQVYLLGAFGLFMGSWALVGVLSVLGLPALLTIFATVVFVIIGILAGIPSLFYYGGLSLVVLFHFFFPGRARNDGVFFIAGPRSSARWYTARALLRRLDNDEILQALQGGTDSPPQIALPIVASASLRRVRPRFRTLLGWPLPFRISIDSKKKARLLSIATFHTAAPAQSDSSLRATRWLTRYHTWLRNARHPQRRPSPSRTPSRLRNAISSVLALCLLIVGALAFLLWAVNTRELQATRPEISVDQGQGNQLLVRPSITEAPWLLQGDANLARPAPDLSGIRELACVADRCVVTDAMLGSPNAPGAGGRLGVREGDAVQWWTFREPSGVFVSVGRFWLADLDGEPRLWALLLPSRSLRLIDLETGALTVPPRFGDVPIDDLIVLNRRTAVITLAEQDADLPRVLVQRRTYISYNGGATWELMPAAVQFATWMQRFPGLADVSTGVTLRLHETATHLLIERAEEDSPPDTVLSVPREPGSAMCGASLSDLRVTVRGDQSAISFGYTRLDGERGLFLSRDEGATWEQVVLVSGAPPGPLDRYLHRCSSDRTLLQYVPDPLLRWLAGLEA